MLFQKGENNLEKLSALPPSCWLWYGSFSSLPWRNLPEFRLLIISTVVCIFSYCLNYRLTHVRRSLKCHTKKENRGKTGKNHQNCWRNFNRKNSRSYQELRPAPIKPLPKNRWIWNARVKWRSATMAAFCRSLHESLLMYIDPAFTSGCILKHIAAYSDLGPGFNRALLNVVSKCFMLFTALS